MVGGGSGVSLRYNWGFGAQLISVPGSFSDNQWHKVTVIKAGHETRLVVDRKVAHFQVWSPSSFKVSCQLLTCDLNQAWSVSLLMTSSTALDHEGFLS